MKWTRWTTQDICRYGNVRWVAYASLQLWEEQQTSHLHSNLAYSKSSAQTARHVTLTPPPGTPDQALRLTTTKLVHQKTVENALT